MCSVKNIRRVFIYKPKGAVLVAQHQIESHSRTVCQSSCIRSITQISLPLWPWYSKISQALSCARQQYISVTERVYVFRTPYALLKAGIFSQNEVLLASITTECFPAASFNQLAGSQLISIFIRSWPARQRPMSLFPQAEGSCFNWPRHAADILDGSDRS